MWPLFIGKAQEKTSVFRTERRRNEQTGATCPWLVRSTATQISILQAEFSLTQVLDRPVTGRIFFEEVIRENLDIGRPDQVQLIFDRRVTRRTPGKFRTRVITDGIVPSLHVDYKNSRIEQYHKEGRALRTETTINNTRDFGIGKLLKNLPELRQIGFQANRRLLDVQTVSHDCSIGEDAFEKVAEYKRRILAGADAARGSGEIGALLRREGLYSSHLTKWRREREAGIRQGLTPQKRGPKARHDPRAAEYQKLRRENERLAEQLRKAEIVIDVQKKVAALPGRALPETEMP
jgi:hypothetical protein